MARKRKPLEKAAVRIGTALGKATRAARAAGESTPRTKKELAQLKKSLSALVQELENATKRVRKALR
jgi:prefoldin subunit 5